MTDSLQKYLAELLGTFTLVFVGTMGILAVRGEVSSTNIAIAFAFGLALLAGLYAFADVSGGHFNPGVSLAMFLDKRLDAAAHDRLLDLPAGRSGAGLALRAHRVQPGRRGADRDAAWPIWRRNGVVPRAARDGDLRARHPQLVGPRTARGHRPRRDPADARRGAPGAHPVQRLLAQHGAELRPGAHRLRVDGLLGLHRRPDRRSDHRVARVLRRREGATAGGGSPAGTAGQPLSRPASAAARSRIDSIRSAWRRTSWLSAAARAAGFGHGRAAARGQPARDVVDVERIDEDARLLADELRRAADVRRDDGAAHRPSPRAAPGRSGSTRLGWQTTRAAAMCSRTSSCGTAPTSCTPRRPESAGRSGPSPTSVSVAVSVVQPLEGLREPHDVLALGQRADEEVRRRAARRRRRRRTARRRLRSRRPRSCRAPRERRARARPGDSRTRRRRRRALRQTQRVARRTTASRSSVRDVLAVGGDDERRPRRERGDEARGHEKVRVDDVRPERPRGPPRVAGERDVTPLSRPCAGRRPPARSRARAPRSAASSP